MRILFALFAGMLAVAQAGHCLAQSEPIEELEARLAADPDNPAVLLALGKGYHNRSNSGEHEEDVEQAERYLSALLEIEPGNGVALVYYGSTLTMKARHAFFPWSKLELMQKGFARMDKAVQREPDKCEVRLIRAINATCVPERFHRLQIALEQSGRIEAAREQYRKAVELKPEGAYAEQVRQRLGAMGE